MFGILEIIYSIPYFPFLCSFRWKDKFGPCYLILAINESEIEIESEVAHLCPTLCDSVDCSQPGSSVHGILQARILEWVAISLSRGSSQPRDRTRVSCTVGRRFTI